MLGEGREAGVPSSSLHYASLPSGCSSLSNPCLINCKDKCFPEFCEPF